MEYPIHIDTILKYRITQNFYKMIYICPWRLFLFSLLEF